MPRGTLVEAWPDLYTAGAAWLGEDARTALEALGAPLKISRAIDAAAIPVYYGAAADEADSLPGEASLRARVLSARGIAVACVTFEASGERRRHEPRSPADPLFHLRRPGGSAGHLWRLFRTRDEASAFLAEHYPHDAAAQTWARHIPTRDWDELVARAAPPAS